MNKETKRQLILSSIFLCLLITTLFLWYDNFIFHTYKNVDDYQYSFRGENDSILIDGYEFYKNKNGQMHGGARIAAMTEKFLLKGDQVTLTFHLISSSKEEYQFEQKYIVRTDNEVCYFDTEETQEKLTQEDFSKTRVTFSITRQKKNIYQEDITMKSQDLVVYNGGNKDYTIENVYATASWLKTGSFASTLKNIEKRYENMTIDYLYLGDQGEVGQINDYVRFVHLTGKTKDFLDGKIGQSVYYDGAGSLLDRELICVISLSNEDDQESDFTFMINLHGSIKAVNTNE